MDSRRPSTSDTLVETSYATEDPNGRAEKQAGKGTQLQSGKFRTTLKEDVSAAGLSKIMERHGRIDLEPLPSDDPAGKVA